MDEKLLATINKIKLLAEQNAEFRQEMQKLFGNTVSASVVNTDARRISHIEKYLGLDFFVDSMDSIIDYTYIDETEVREKLIAANREMMRFRFGTRSHKIDFEEYCRYAQLQAEMLLNYFYTKKESSIQSIISHIKQYNEKAKISDDITNISSISFSVKLWAYDKEFKLNLRETFDHVREVRNNQSHRTPQKEVFSIEAYQKKLIEWGIVLRKDGSFDYYQTIQNPAAYSIYESKVQRTKDYSKYNFLLWLNGKPYDDVIEKLKSLALSIKKNLFSNDI